MGARQKGPIGLSDFLQNFKDGTLARTRSPLPRSTGLTDDTQDREGVLDLGYAEEAHEPHIRIRIVGHASPRWRSAANASIADQRNYELAVRRTKTVKAETEKLLRAYSSLQFVEFDVSLENEDGTVAMQSSSRGSRDTLREANNDRSDNHQARRRVDVYFEVRARKTGDAGISVPMSYKSTATRDWLVSVDVSAGASLGAAGRMLKITLINGHTEQKMHGTVWAGGGGPKASLGVTASIWSNPTPFTTESAVNFEDFRKRPVRYTTGGITLFLGYEFAYISFYGLGPGAKRISVGGWNTGTVDIGGSVTAGRYHPDGKEPPNRIPIKNSDQSTIPFERRESMKEHHPVWFETNTAEMSSVETALLDSLVRSILNQ